MPVNTRPSVLDENGCIKRCPSGVSIACSFQRVSTLVTEYNIKLLMQWHYYYIEAYGRKK